MNQDSSSELETEETRAFDLPQQNVRLNTLSLHKTLKLIQSDGSLKGCLIKMQFITKLFIFRMPSYTPES